MPADVETEVEPESSKPRAVRDHIVEAAQRIIRERGLSRATTRAIALEAGCAEGSIYRYFPDKHALFIECVKERHPQFLEMMDTLPQLAGLGSPRQHLEEVAKASLLFYRAILPMVAGAMAERELLEQQRRHFSGTTTGPRKLIARLAEYIKGEQRLGRLSTRVSPDSAARMLLGAAWFKAYLEVYLGEEGPASESDERFARETVRGLMEGLHARQATGRTKESG